VTQHGGADPVQRRIITPEVESYLAELGPRRHAVLEEMERSAAKARFPIVGPLVGRLLELLARSVQATRVFEMGSGFGYSTMWFARAVGPGGRVWHTDGSEQNSLRARGFLERSGLADRVSFQTGDAREILKMETGPFDVVFCDIDKEQYPDVPVIALPRLRTGGLLVFDNMLWFGRVLLDPPPDDATRGVRRVTELLIADERLVTTIIPLRDGVSVSIKLP